MREERGYTLLEALTVVAIAGLILAMAVPSLDQFRRSGDLVRLARQIADDGLRCRMEALTSGRNVGLVFADVDEHSYYVMVADGDHDGVSRADYLRGVDRALGAKVWVHFLSGGTRLGVPVSWRVPDPSGNGILDARGLRVGSSQIMSFSKSGGATPSSVYFNDGRDRMLAVRVDGENGRIRALMWRRGWPRWHDVRL